MLAKVSVKVHSNINLTKETRKNSESVRRENPEASEKCCTRLIKYSFLYLNINELLSMIRSEVTLTSAGENELLVVTSL